MSIKDVEDIINKYKETVENNVCNCGSKDNIGFLKPRTPIIFIYDTSKSADIANVEIQKQMPIIFQELVNEGYKEKEIYSIKTNRERCFETISTVLTTNMVGDKNIKDGKTDEIIFVSLINEIEAVEGVKPLDCSYYWVEFDKVKGDWVYSKYNNHYETDFNSLKKAIEISNRKVKIIHYCIPSYEKYKSATGCFPFVLNEIISGGKDYSDENIVKMMGDGGKNSDILNYILYNDTRFNLLVNRPRSVFKNLPKVNTINNLQNEILIGSEESVLSGSEFHKDIIDIIKK